MSVVSSAWLAIKSVLFTSCRMSPACWYPPWRERARSGQSQCCPALSPFKHAHWLYATHHLLHQQMATMLFEQPSEDRVCRNAYILCRYILKSACPPLLRAAPTAECLPSIYHARLFKGEVWRTCRRFREAPAANYKTPEQIHSSHR